ncbi:hypothetical protein [Aestuariivirga litoralis]|uniref:hypothetical protein n=1 Tax=Aestuariivirga litoralis TaxID=2650924 RepID=UPI0018C51AF6|nr:hypothetical protein [Aestuariivirga litoralis]MBG1233520.1 hypothetical protein [Aestuariivirga litoralis]
MRFFVLALSALAISTTAQADAVKSVYTKIDLKKCRQTEKADEYVFGGTWACKGLGGYDVFVSSADDRESAAFGKVKGNNCAGLKTFNGFNSVGNTVEWRVKNGKPFAAILRWTVSIDPEDSTKQATWLVVSKLEKGEACHMHYVSGSYPNANAQAQKAADDLAVDFKCETDVPTVDSKVGPPGITMESCSGLARE